MINSDYSYFIKKGNRVIEITIEKKTVTYVSGRKEEKDLLSFSFFEDNENRVEQFANKIGDNRYYIKDNKGRYIAEEVNGIIVKCYFYNYPVLFYDLYDVISLDCLEFELFLDKTDNFSYIMSKVQLEFRSFNIYNIDVLRTFSYAFYYRTKDDLLYCFELNKVFEQDLTVGSIIIFNEDEITFPIITEFKNQYTYINNNFNTITKFNQYHLFYSVDKNLNKTIYGLPEDIRKTFVVLKLTNSIGDTEFWLTYSYLETIFKRKLGYTQDITISINKASLMINKYCYIKFIIHEFLTDREHLTLDYVSIKGNNIHKFNLIMTDIEADNLRKSLAKDILLTKLQPIESLVLYFNKDLKFEKFDVLRKDK